MFLKFAFRNLLRNKKRTFTSALSVFTAAMLVGVAYGWVNGVFSLYSEGFIKYQTGNVRIVTQGYESREKFMPVDEVIVNADEIAAKIRKIEGVTSVEERVRFGILMGKEDNTVTAVGMGLDVKNNSFGFADKIIEGGLAEHGIYLGVRLAESLRLKVGEEILIASKTSQGGLNGIKVKVAGIFKMKMASFDKHFFFLNLADAKKLLKIHSGVTEIYAFTQNPENSAKLRDQIKPLLGAGLVVKTYGEQMGGLDEILKMMKSIFFFIEIAILALACFVIINTMVMAIFERMREIGTLKALGFTEADLFIIFTGEGAMIGILGGIPGAIIGFLGIYLWGKTGINLEGMLKDIEMPLEYVIHPALSFFDIFSVLALATIVPIVSSMIPARYIRRYLPSDALRM
jgi:putative ABC transport system permease protein